MGEFHVTIVTRKTWKLIYLTLNLNNLILPLSGQEQWPKND